MSDYSALPVQVLAGRLRTGEVSLETYLNYLELRFRRWEPAILAFLEEDNRFDRLRDEARRLESHYPQPDLRPRLYGLPIGVKDIFHVDGFRTHAGSALPPERLQGSEARSIRILREAGALIMGKTVTTEFAYFAPGPTRNPHDLNRTPGGSSSGSAAAVAAGLCPLATGTQTIGSIVRPASFCGVVGYKPTYDRVSREGVIPLSESLDHIGFFSRDVSGLSLVASLLASGWQSVIPEEKPTLGIPDGPYLGRASSESREHLERIYVNLADAGYTVKHVQTMPDFDDIVTRHNMIMAAEAANTHRNWYEEFAHLYHKRTAELIEYGKSISEVDFDDAYSSRERLRHRLQRQMQEAGIDLWLSPAAPGPAPLGLDSTGDPVMNLPWTHSGLPVVCLPAGVGASGMPMGIQIVGRWYQDEMLLSWCETLESIFGQTPVIT